MSDKGYAIQDESPVSFFTMIPHLVDDSDISPYAIRLYLHLKRVAGENGRCWQSQDTLEKACRMSNRTIVKAKRELGKAGFIVITLDAVGGHPQHIITIVDIWKQNENVYRGKSAPDPHSHGVDQHPIAVEISTSKNTPIRIPNNLSSEVLIPDDLEHVIIEILRRAGVKDPDSHCVELLRRARAEFPQLDLLAESKAWAARKLSEPLTKRSRPLGQLWNWFRKAEEFRKERHGAHRGDHGSAGVERFEESATAPLR